MEFSIIIPVYNVEAYLEGCLRSILSQTFRDFELLLIDDGSTDGSGEICDACARQNPQQVRVLHQENAGCNRSRVRGLREAKGEICIFVDSDDALRQDALELLHKAFSETGCDLVLYGLTRDPDFSAPAYEIPLEKGRCFAGESKKELYSLMATAGSLNSMCMKAAKKSIYDSFLKDYSAKADMAYGEDLYLSLPLVTNAKSILWLGETLYYYRDRPGSMVNSFCPSLHRSMKIVRMELEKYIAIWGVPECYPAFYARVVYNWTHALKELLKHQSSLTKAERGALLQELSQDEFFRKSYESMQPGYLCRRDRLLAGWLYRGRLMWLGLMGRCFNLLKKS